MIYFEILTLKVSSYAMMRPKKKNVVTILGQKGYFWESYRISEFVADLVFTTLRGRQVKFYSLHFADEATEVHGKEGAYLNVLKEHRTQPTPKPSSSDIFQHLGLHASPSSHHAPVELRHSDFPCNFVLQGESML